MRSHERGAGRAEAGITLVELMVALMVTAILGAMVATWMTSAVRAVNLHRADDVAVQDLRQAKDLLTRELRVASGVSAISPTAITFWVDADFSGAPDEGETITWSIESDGTLARWTDAGGKASALVILDHVVLGESIFEFDTDEASEVRRVAITLVVTAGDTDRTRSLSTEIFVRNAG
jgi:type II secretory pathway pseudopilin PulG